MLPITTQRTSTSSGPPITASTTFIEASEKPKRHSLVLTVRRLLATRSKPTYAALTAAALLFLWIVSRPRKHHYKIAPLSLTGTAENWGDYVGQGHARAKVIESTPSGYADLGNRKGGLYGVAGMVLAKDSARKERDKAKQEWWERSRRGVLGGGSVQWSEGVVGMGSWLGDTVDMRKEAVNEEEIGGEVEVRREALTSHIVDRAWRFLDEEDETNTEEMMAKAKKERTLDKLPLRDRVRGNPELEREAAESWSRVYAAMLGEGGKSALEVQVEKTVRSWPVVVFSLVECEHSKRAKKLLANYKITPAPHIVEVDLRPDQKTLRGLLLRKTGHATFPNIIIGGTSIGGADDLAAKEKKGDLLQLLKNAGAVAKPA